MEETTTKLTQRELIQKFLGMLHSVENDYNQETVSDFEEELRNIEKSLCSDCGDNGTFFFTKDNKLEDSQPCGKCNKKSLDAIVQYTKLKESYLERVSTANKIISEKIDEIKKLKEENEELLIENNKLSNEIQDNYRVFDETESLKQEINQLKQLKQRMEKLLDFNHNLLTCRTCIELQQLLKD